jgi:hypothetical protein
MTLQERASCSLAARAHVGLMDKAMARAGKLLIFSRLRASSGGGLMGDRDDQSGDMPSAATPQVSLWRLGFTAKLTVITALLVYALAPLVVIILLGARIGNLVPFWIVGAIPISLLIALTAYSYFAGDDTPSPSVLLLEQPRQALQLSLLVAWFVLLISLGYYALLHITATDMPLVFQGIIFIFFGGAALILGVMASTARGRQSLSVLFPVPHNPYAYPGLLVTLIALMTSLFGSASFVLQRLEVIHFHAVNGTRPNVDTLMGFYIWHFFDTLPVLEVTKTLHWAAPVKDYDRAAGVLLILYTITVIVPVIALFIQMTKATSGTAGSKR